ncbi:MAG: carbohydrate ABC transporter permease [Oscillospiraceae bacterium]|nr:carbohydrate ABC transporter permease [Oscillospiraceae bacterium]
MYTNVRYGSSLLKGAKSTAITIAIVIICIAAIFPLFWMISLSLRDIAFAGNPSITYWFANVNLQSYINLFRLRNIQSFLVNSFVISITTTVVSLILGSITAYGMARYNFKKKESMAFFLLSMRMIPAIAAVIPFFVISIFVGILDTRLVLIIAYMTFNIPFTVWMMRGFFEEIPKEVEEAALVDGCSTIGVLIKVVLPLSTPGLMATAIFCIINSWNELIFALFLTTFRAPTLPTTVQMFMSIQGIQWNEMAAVGVISTGPILLFAMFVQRYMVRGLTFGAVKG